MITINKNRIKRKRGIISFPLSFTGKGGDGGVFWGINREMRIGIKARGRKKVEVIFKKTVSVR